MNVNHKLLETLNTLGKRREKVERLYARMLDESLFLKAYGRIYANKGAMTEGVNTDDTIDGMSLKRIRTIIQQLQNGEWRWQPVRRSYVPKANGGTRALGIPSWSDKLVQEVMRMVLEAYYEPRFLDESHGFRPGRSCHTALVTIKQKWTGVVWFVEGDIKSYFDSIDHEQLLNIISKSIRDFRFLKLLRTMLQAGYWSEEGKTPSFSGTPQGGVVSPLLANIFLHELDHYVVNELKPQFDRGKRRAMNHDYKRIIGKMSYAKKLGQKERYLDLLNQRKGIPRSDAFDPNFRRLLYIRYADDFLIGIIGSKTDANNLKNMVGNKLNSMGLNLSESKTKITHAAQKARFLGYDIYVKNRLNDRSLNGTVLLSVPEDVVTKLKQRYTRKGKGTSRPYLSVAPDEEIIVHYDRELRGYYNYYKLAHNVSNRIGSVKTVMWWSLMHTLASKHRTRITKIWRKLQIQGTRSGLKCVGMKIVSASGKERYITFGDFNMKWSKNPEIYPDKDAYIKGLQERELTHRLKHDVCELCGSIGETEVHHIRRMKDVRYNYRNGQIPRWKMIMASRNRKTLVVCKSCHQEIHCSDN